MRPVRRACVCAHLSLIGGDDHDWVFARLIVATAVAFVLVMVVVRTFAVVVVVACAALIHWICTALRVRMLGVRPMHVAGLLGGTFSRSLAVASAILVVCLALVAVEGVTIARLVIAIEVVVAIVLPVAAHSLVDNTLEFVVIARLKLVAKLTTSCLADLVLAFPLKRAIANPRVVNTFEVLRKGCERFIEESASASDVLRAIRLVKAHVKPLNLQSSVGACDVSFGEKLHDSQHLLEPM